MRTFITLAVTALVFCVTGTSRGQEQPEGWITLFNGKDLAGWTAVNDGKWSVEDGAMKYTPPGKGWLRSKEQFTDFQVIAEWRFPKTGLPNDAGFFIRAAAEGKPWPAPAYQLNMGPGSNLASLGSMRGAPRVQGAGPVPQLVKPAGEWNTYDLIVVGNAATLIVNGTKAWDASAVGLLQGGHLGWQVEDFPLEIRSVRVRKLAASKGAE